MKVLVQWSQGTPADWDVIDSSAWMFLPTKARPLNGDRRLIDDVSGWITSVNVQGNIFSGDVIAIEDMPHGGVRVTQLNDDPSDWSGFRYARVWDIPPIGHDPNMGNAINTLWRQTVYADSTALKRIAGIPCCRTEYHPWDKFVPPPAATQKFGVWLSDALYNDHLSSRSSCGWRTWCEHLPTEEVRNGRLKSQRARGRYIPPKGTLTWYHNNTARTLGGISANVEHTAATTPGGAATSNSGNIGTGGIDAYAAQTLNIIGLSQWPTGNYRHQIDVTTTTADLVCGLLTLGSGSGGFVRAQSDGTSLEKKQQQESSFAGTGLHLATSGSVSWSSGATTNYYQVLIAGQKTAGHGNDTMDLQVGESDDFLDGPFPSGAAPDVTLFFGKNH